MDGRPSATVAGDVPIIFAPARGARLAYQVFGSGPATVVAIPPTAQNIEIAWERPEIRHMFERFGSFCRYLHFDKRGTGCSDRRNRVGDIDERVDDLRAVMDHAGIQRAHLFGLSEGGPMTLLFAATYPDRVAGLILFGTGASMHPPGMTDAQIADRRERNRRYAARWGTPDSPVAAGFAPSLVARDPSFADWHQRYERLAASSDSLEDLLELGLAMDVRELLPTVDVPALVIHRTNDRVIPVALGRELAAALPDARLVEQPGEDHFAYAGDVDGWMDELERFVTGEVRSASVAHRARPSVRVRTLGRFAVEANGEEVPVSSWGSRRSRQLLKRLVAGRGWPVTRDELFDLLWPQETQPHRLGPRLSVQLSLVRRVLRGGVISDRESVRLDLDEVATDLEELYQAADDEGIVAVYGGEFLPDDRFEDWSDAPRTAARNRFASAARRLGLRALEAGDVEGAVDLAERLIELDRYDEDAHRLRVTARLRSGATAQASAAHAEWASAIAELDLVAPPLSELEPG